MLVKSMSMRYIKSCPYFLHLQQAGCQNGFSLSSIGVAAEWICW